MNWESEHIDIGEVKVNSTTTVRFKMVEVPKNIGEVKLETSCGCSTPSFNKDSGFVSVIYKAGKIPLQRKPEGFYVTTKSIRVITDLGTSRLTFKATVKE